MPNTFRIVVPPKLQRCASGAQTLPGAAASFRDDTIRGETARHGVADSQCFDMRQTSRGKMNEWRLLPVSESRQPKIGGWDDYRKE
jgi:hypothetical protein